MSSRPDPPELIVAIDELRAIYWREYGYGWRDAVKHIKEVLARPSPFIEGDRVDPSDGAVSNIGDKN